MNSSSDRTCARLSPEELMKRNMPVPLPEETVPGNEQIDSLRETVLQMQATASAFARRAAQIQETLKEMETRHRKDWQTIENLQKEMKILLRDKEQQVGNLLDRTSLQIEKFNRRDLITRWALNILFALPSLLILVLVILQGLLPLFRF